LSEGSPFARASDAPLDPAKFRDPQVTAKGEKRASVRLERLETLWLNTGTLCNLACKSCYIESSPRNDALLYLTLPEAERYLDEALAMGTREIGFTGGEPFMNPDMIAMLQASLERGFEVLVLTNAMRPMLRFERELLALLRRFGSRLTVRVSVDHYRQAVHEAERGANSWDKTISGLRWLSANGFALAVAGRSLPGESEAEARSGYEALFRKLGIAVDAGLVIFPQMDRSADVPEITVDCWSILDVAPSSVMCASSRMVVKRKGASAPEVVACTLLPYDEQFALGSSLAGAAREVPLNHPHCARFCVLGGASCSA
jgi:uncharacterized Fe-S cluster-containing radical SAM superfamily protein